VASVVGATRYFSARAHQGSAPWACFPPNATKTRPGLRVFSPVVRRVFRGALSARNVSADAGIRMTRRAAETPVSGLAGRSPGGTSGSGAL
jgi:hypothetical protein